MHCRTVGDAVRVLDAVKDFETVDVYTAIPPAMIPKEPYASFLVTGAAASGKALSGMRIGIVREFMVKHVKQRRGDRRSDRQGDQDLRVLRANSSGRVDLRRIEQLLMITYDVQDVRPY